jgi:hypothetical protein
MIERVNLQLHAALQGVNDARAAASLARPDRGTAAIARQLADIETALRSALRTLSSDLHHDDRNEGSEMQRRALLKLTTALAGTAITPLAPLERIASALDHPGQVDAGLLDAYAEVTTTYAQAFYTLPPAQLTGPVRAHLDRLVALTNHPTTPALRTRLEAMISDTAAFAGMLAYDLDQPGAARAHLTLAADAAQQAGDPTLHALALQARLHAQIAPHDPRTSALLDQALSTLPDHTPAAARAWLAVHHATDCAATGDRLGYEAGTEVARAAHQQPDEPASASSASTAGITPLPSPTGSTRTARGGWLRFGTARPSPSSSAWSTRRPPIPASKPTPSTRSHRCTPARTRSTRHATPPAAPSTSQLTTNSPPSSARSAPPAPTSTTTTAPPPSATSTPPSPQPEQVGDPVMGEAIVAIVAAAVGGVLTLAGELLRRRLSRCDRWLDELHRAASDVSGSYGRVRNALIEARRDHEPLEGREALEYGQRSVMVARLMSIPGAERLRDDLDDMSETTWQFRRATEKDVSDEEWEARATAQRNAIRKFEQTVRSLLR